MTTLNYTWQKTAFTKQSKRHTADENTDWLYLIRDCRLLFHKNDYSDEFIDTNYYKQNKQNDDFEL